MNRTSFTNNYCIIQLVGVSQVKSLHYIRERGISSTLVVISSITVPTTCSRPSIEMVGFITVPTTCSRPSIEMVGFIYLFIYYCADYL